MSVEEYEQKFDKLSHLASKMVARKERFIQGLRSGVQGLVHAHEPKTYVVALRATVRIDADA